MSTIRVLSYNIHKGFNHSGRKFILDNIRHAIRDVGADLVFLQEVLGDHRGTKQKILAWPNNAQFEFLADQSWSHYAYGKNAVYTDGHHGNAILSKHPFLSWENIDISTSQFARRGLLHGVVQVPHFLPIHTICLHLDLHKAGRAIQTKFISSRIENQVGAKDPLILAGDFNDWRGHAGEILEKELHLKEAQKIIHGKLARTFPSRLPTLKLDRIYFRGLEVKEAKILKGSPWSQLSDHLALLADFKLLK